MGKGSMLEKMDTLFEQILMLIAIGAAVPIGRGLIDQGKPSWRVIAGRVIVNAVFTLSAGGLLVWIPGVPLFGLLGLAAGLSSLGQSGVERWARRYLDSRRG